MNNVSKYLKLTSKTKKILQMFGITGCLCNSPVISIQKSQKSFFFIVHTVLNLQKILRYKALTDGF